MDNNDHFKKMLFFILFFKGRSFKMKKEIHNPNMLERSIYKAEYVQLQNRGVPSLLQRIYENYKKLEKLKLN